MITAGVNPGLAGWGYPRIEAYVYFTHLHIRTNIMNWYTTPTHNVHIAVNKLPGKIYYI
jgi:hypothetical protein